MFIQKTERTSLELGEDVESGRVTDFLDPREAKSSGGSSTPPKSSAVSFFLADQRAMFKFNARMLSNTCKGVFKTGVSIIFSIG